jgi:hypothetical protein
MNALNSVYVARHAISNNILDQDLKRNRTCTKYRRNLLQIVQITDYLPMIAQ